MDSSNLDSAAHTDGMFWPHVLPGQAIVQQTAQAGSADVRSFREHSNLTSRGLHSMVAVPSLEGSSSASDPTITGLVGLLASFGRERAADHAAERGSPHGPLSAGEIGQLLIASASPITVSTDPGLGWPAP